MTCNCNKVALYNLFHLILRRWLQFLRIFVMVQNYFSASEFILKDPFLLFRAKQNTCKSYIDQNQIEHISMFACRHFEQPWKF